MARVELSSKVVDCEDRLQRTLAHELCHVAAWLLDHVSKPPHGQVHSHPVMFPCAQPVAHRRRRLRQDRMPYEQESVLL